MTAEQEGALRNDVDFNFEVGGADKLQLGKMVGGLTILLFATPSGNQYAIALTKRPVSLLTAIDDILSGAAEAAYAGENFSGLAMRGCDEVFATLVARSKDDLGFAIHMTRQELVGLKHRLNRLPPAHEFATD